MGRMAPTWFDCPIKLEQNCDAIDTRFLHYLAMLEFENVQGIRGTLGHARWPYSFDRTNMECSDNCSGFIATHVPYLTGKYG